MLTKIVKALHFLFSAFSELVFLRLASLAVLMGTLYTQITCTPVDECHVGTGDCTQLRVSTIQWGHT